MLRGADPTARLPVGTTRGELHHVLTTIGEFVDAEPQLLPGVFHFKGNVPADEAAALLDLAEAAFVPRAAPGCDEYDRSAFIAACARCREYSSRSRARRPRREGEAGAVAAAAAIAATLSSAAKPAESEH